MSDLLDFSPPGQTTFPLSGAKARFYDAGTTTLRTVYSDEGETVPHADPLVADASGRWPQVFVSGGAVKVVVTQSDDSTGYTLDPCVKVAATGSSAAATSFTPSILRPQLNVQDAIDLGTFPPRTITGSGIVNVTNGDGQAGNPTIAVAPITTAEIAAATLVTAADTIASNDNDTTIPTSAAVKDYVDASSGITLSTAVASTSGTNVDFTGIPSTARRVTLMLAALSTSGTNNLVCQIGAGSFLATGYISQYSFGTTFASSTTSFGLANSIAGTSLLHGAVTLDLIGSNLWVARSMIITASNVVFVGSGSVTIAGALDRIRLTTVGGTDTFDAGTVNISWE